MYLIHRSTLRFTVTLLLIASLISLTGPAAAAFAREDNKSKDGSEAPPVSGPAETAATAESATTESAVPAAVETKTINISYALYSNAIKLEPAPGPSPAPVFKENVLARLNAPTTTTAPRAPAVSTAPMTVGEKFNYFLNRSFRPPGPYAQSIFSGLYNELLDNNEGKEDTLDDFFADAMTRAARSFGNRIANNFFEKFAYASIFRQDPRYHRSGKSGAGAKLGWALSRLVITQGDRGGDQFNISFLAGGLTGAFVSQPWQREEKQNTSDTFKRWGNHIAITALSNILREFLGGQ